MVLVCAKLGTFLFSTQKNYYANCFSLRAKNYLAQYLADVIGGDDAKKTNHQPVVC